ncbi:MAG: flagellar hook-basal body complex protein FliE [Acidobacteria bacterium]|nr:flagellar hook-basal body complex protein FliE [Acidobacteriota bacterium]
MALTTIGSLPSLGGLATGGNTGAAPDQSGGSFGDSLTKLLESVETTAADANTAVAKMADGSGDVHTAMLALQRSEISMQLTVQVRNKLVAAYQDLMRMPI